jgi:hypothetical protein
MAESKITCRILVGKTERKRPGGRARRGWKDNIKMDFTETGWGSVDRIHLALDRAKLRAFVKTGTKLRVPKNLRNLLNS